jgi:predicted mannosyl-3-phosphoglycerate phosphatase (HAD superfamily)
LKFRAKLHGAINLKLTLFSRSKSAIRKEGLHFTIGGKYNHLIGAHDKAKAVLLLKELFSKKFKQIRIVGVGNQFNDSEMLEAVDMPFFIAKPQEIWTEWEKIISVISNLSS